jgi:hypothetical protein
MLAFLGHQPQDSQPSALKRMYDKVIAHRSGGPSITQTLMKAAPVRTGVESLGTGGVLALIHATNTHGHGLDVEIKKADASGKGGFSVAADLVLGLGGLGAGAPNVASSAFGVFAFRKTMDLLATKRAKDGKPAPVGTVGVVKVGGAASPHAGEGDEDPILRAARAHGYA